MTADTTITGQEKETTTTSVGTITVVAKLDTAKLSKALRMFALSAKLYLAVTNLIYTMRGKKTRRLTISVGIKDA